MKQLGTKLGVFVAALLLSAGASAEPMCWDEGGGSTLVLSLGLSDGDRFSFYGHKSVTGLTCQGMRILPVTAEATMVGNQVVFGMQVHAVDPGICVSSRRLVILNLSSLSGTGKFRNDQGTEGSLTLTKLSTCPTAALSPPAAAPTTPGQGAVDIENQVPR